MTAHNDHQEHFLAFIACYKAVVLDIIVQMHAIHISFAFCSDVSYCHSDLKISSLERRQDAHIL